MCVNGWSAEHDEWNCKAQKHCFRDVRASPLQYTVSHAQTVQSVRAAGVMELWPGPFLSSFPDGLLRNASSFLELFSALAQLPYCNMKNPWEKGTSGLCRQCKVQHFLTGNGGGWWGGCGGWNKQPRERRTKMAKKAEEKTKLIKPFWSSLQSPGCDETEWLPEGQASCHLSGEWTRSLNWVWTKPY